VSAFVRGLAVLLLALAASAVAARHHHRHNYGDQASAAPAVTGRFDYYLLSLSWSPSYCLTHPEDRAQCSRGFGFVLHGLWPQYDGGGYPENCGAAAPLDAAALAIGQTLFPSPRLMEHEWRRHGRCSGLPAADYFRTADRALAVVRVPPAFEAPHVAAQLTASEIVAAFVAANARLSVDGLTVACTRDELAEVRVCLTRELAPRRCGRGVRSACPDVPLKIPAAR
jgi:ribonuclease T2